MTQIPHPAIAAGTCNPIPFAQVHEVRAEVERIEQLVDTEHRISARWDAVQLTTAVLEAIASGNAQSGYLAAEVLKVSRLLA